jgi:hypothetical protein
MEKPEPDPVVSMVSEYLESRFNDIIFFELKAFVLCAFKEGEISSDSVLLTFDFIVPTQKNHGKADIQ